MDKFDVNVLLDACSKCVDKDDNISTDHFLCVCSELIKFYKLLGFGAVLNPCSKCITALELRRVTGSGCHYRKLHLLLEHEHDTGQSTGTQAIIGMNAHIAFVASYMTQLALCETAKEKFTAKKKWDIYKASILYTHHSPVTRSSIQLASVQAAGRQKTLTILDQYCHGDKKAIQIVRDLANGLQKITEKIQNDLDQKSGCVIGNTSNV